jgi:hypothetical protein
MKNHNLKTSFTGGINKRERNFEVFTEVRMMMMMICVLVPSRHVYMASKPRRTTLSKETGSLLEK